jgi:hypothetical protein
VFRLLPLLQRAYLPTTVMSAQFAELTQRHHDIALSDNTRSVGQQPQMAVSIRDTTRYNKSIASFERPIKAVKMAAPNEAVILNSFFMVDG